MSDSRILMDGVQNGNFRSIARAITMVENELPGYEELLRLTSTQSTCKVIGITGPPGAGKSTLINGLLGLWSKEKKVAVISIDPSSPFNLGALLGDRIRMREYYLNPNVFIRSLASRGALGGVCAKIIEILDVVKSAPFDYVIIETVGVGQSEIEISGIADTTVVVMVPEAGDEVQTMKAGIMEIANIFVVNKADRSQADEFIKNLKMMVHERDSSWVIPVLKCIATEDKGLKELSDAIDDHVQHHHSSDQHLHLLAEKAYNLIADKRMKGITKTSLYEELKQAKESKDFNFYTFIQTY